MISLCTPTRGRPESFKKMCLSILENVSDPNAIEFIIYRDNDDDAVYEYFGNYKELRGERILQSAMYNECYKIAAGPIYMFLPDDMIFETKDWDKYVTEIFDNSIDKIIFVHPNDKYFRSSFGQVGFLHKNWIDTVGYFLPPYFAAGLADKWINYIAKKINRRVFLRLVVIKHVYFEGDTIHMVDVDHYAADKTHTEYMERGRQSNSVAIYYSKEAEMLRDAKLLQDFIDNYGKTVT